MSRKCEVTNKVFSKKGNLVPHKRTHTGDKPYECDVCNKRFPKLSNLTVHKRTHTADKPFECDVCKKRFSRSDHLANIPNDATKFTFQNTKYTAFFQRISYRMFIQIHQETLGQYYIAFSCTSLDN